MKTNVHGTVSQLNNEMLGIYFDRYYDLLDPKKSKIESVKKNQVMTYCHQKVRKEK